MRPAQTFKTIKVHANAVQFVKVHRHQNDKSSARKTNVFDLWAVSTPLTFCSPFLNALLYPKMTSQPFWSLSRKKEEEEEEKPSKLNVF